MDIKAFLSSLKLPKLTEEQNESLIKDITTQELLTEITKLKLNKSPGTDGFTAEWYKKFKEQLNPILLPACNATFHGREIPISWNEAIISPIPKEGKNKLDCASYMPISVLNADYKLYTVILTRRIEHLLPELIHDDS